MNCASVAARIYLAVFRHEKILWKRELFELAEIACSRVAFHGANSARGPFRRLTTERRLPLARALAEENRQAEDG